MRSKQVVIVRMRHQTIKPLIAVSVETDVWLNVGLRVSFNCPVEFILWNHKDREMPELSEDQMRAVETSKKRKFSLISGPPGSGKTTLLVEFAKDPEVVFLAPTGTSADRITQSTEKRAHVVDKVLFDREGSVKFGNKRLVVDEAGMLSTDSLDRIFRFLKPESVVLIGDPKQLPCPSGYPALNTLMGVHSVPQTRLTRLWRRNGEKEGSLDRCLRTLGTPEFDINDQDETFKIVVCQTQEECYKRAAAEYLKSPCQILTYTNKAVSELNRMTENKSAKTFRGIVRCGDRVVCTENFYVKKHLKVANGTCGTAIENIGVKYDNGYIDAKKETKFDPCRCMTINKSQGNEYSVHGVLVISPWMGPPPLELAYTGLSRFKKSVVVYGTKWMIESAMIKGRFAGIIDDKLSKSLFVKFS